MLIWGWRGRKKTLSEGVFYSPALGHDGQYRLIEMRRWFTLFFIPIIPLKVLGTFVECQESGATYDPRILEGGTNAEFLDQLSAGVREIVAKVAMADGEITDEERRLAVEIVSGYVPTYDLATFQEDLDRVSAAPLDDRLLYLSGSLDVEGREKLLTAAATVMTADGSIDDRDRKAVTDIGEGLGMSASHIRGVVDSVAEHIASTD